MFLTHLQVQMLLEEGVAPKDIGVIAPYNAQVKQ
jgi:superfamily I DNA and/or RNA helicase